MSKYKLLSVHTPKAGGSSLAKSLHLIFGDEFIADSTDDPANPLSERNVNPVKYFLRNDTLPEDIKCLHGHFNPGKFYLGENIVLSTILRHPIDNILSIYAFWKGIAAHGQPLHDYFVRNRLNLFEMAQLPLLRFLYSRSYFGEFDMSRFDLIGRYEDRHVHIEKLAEILDINIDNSFHENETPFDEERENLRNDKKCLDKLADILSEDINFYECVCN